jgi:hypothetical protein
MFIGWLVVGWFMGDLDGRSWLPSEIAGCVFYGVFCVPVE